MKEKVAHLNEFSLERRSSSGRRCVSNSCSLWSPVYKRSCVREKLRRTRDCCVRDACITVKVAYKKGIVLRMRSLHHHYLVREGCYSLHTRRERAEFKKENCCWHNDRMCYLCDIELLFWSKLSSFHHLSPSFHINVCGSATKASTRLKIHCRTLCADKFVWSEADGVGISGPRDWCMNKNDSLQTSKLTIDLQILWEMSSYCERIALRAREEMNVV